MKRCIVDALHGNQPKLPILSGIHYLAGSKNMPGGSRQGGDHQKTDPHTAERAEPDPLMAQQIWQPDEEKQNRQPQSLGDPPLQKPGAYPGILGQVDFHIRRRRFLGRLTGPGCLFQKFLLFFRLPELGRPGAQYHSQQFCQLKPIVDAIRNKQRADKCLPHASGVSGSGIEGKAQMIDEDTPEKRRQECQQRHKLVILPGQKHPALNRPEPDCRSAEYGRNPADQIIRRQKAVRAQHRAQE